MAIVKVHLEAVRYLSAKAVFDNDESCKAIMSMTTYKRRSVGFTNLLNYPYYRDSNSPRACNIVSDMLTDAVGENWYKVLVYPNGAKFIAGVLKGEITSPLENVFQGSLLNDRDLLIFYKQQEMLFETRSN